MKPSGFSKSQKVTPMTGYQKKPKNNISEHVITLDTHTYWEVHCGSYI